MKKRTRLYTGLSLSLGLYTLASYLLLLRDDFILERLSLALNWPFLLTAGRYWSHLLHTNWSSIILLSLSLISSFCFYFKILHYPSKNFKPLIYFLCLNSLILLLSFPALSTDVFDYINSNRVAFVHHHNPWITPPQTFPHDDLIYFGSWNFRASVYPPFMFLLSSLVHLTFGTNILLAIFGFKLLALVFYFAILYLFYHLHAPDTSDTCDTFDTSRMLLLFAFNPLVLIEFIGNAHHDLVMGFFALLTFYFWHKRQYFHSGVALALGFLSKFTVILYLPLLFIHLFQKKRNLLFPFIFSFSLTSLAGLFPLGKAFPHMLTNLNTQLQIYLKSLPTIIRYIFDQLITDPQQAINLQKLTSLPILFLIYYLIQRRRQRPLLEQSVLLMLFYLIFAAPMLQPWYLAWFLPLTPLLRSFRLQLTSIVFTVSSMLHYIIFNASFYLQPLNFTWQIILYLVIILPPLITLALPRSVILEYQKQSTYEGSS